MNIIDYITNKCNNVHVYTRICTRKDFDDFLLQCYI